MNRLEWLEAQADEAGDGVLWHEWRLSDLIRAARALEAVSQTSNNLPPETWYGVRDSLAPLLEEINS